MKFALLASDIVRNGTFRRRSMLDIVMTFQAAKAQKKAERAAKKALKEATAA